MVNASFTPDDLAAALRRLAQLMDEDDARTGKVGIPVSYGHFLAALAVSGTVEEWDAEWLRLLRTQGMQAAKAWGDEQEKRTRTLIGLVYPGGAVARAKSATEVRALADSLAAEPAHSTTDGRDDEDQP